MTTATYKIGEKVWFKGDEYTITSDAYKVGGGYFQDAVGEGGKTVGIATPATVNENADRNIREYRDQQAAFARLHKITA